MQNRKIWLSVIVILLFLATNLLVDYFRPDSGPFWFRFMFQYFCWLLCIGLGLRICGIRLIKFATDIGLVAKPLYFILWSLLLSAPMLIGFSLTASISPSLTISGFFTSSVFPGFFEEIFYRGFLFYLLWKKFSWNFVLAALASALTFGLGHWYQGGDWISALQIVLFTGIGGVWFAWLFKEWKSIWLPIGLHILMNAYWYIWEISDTAVGSQTANVIRLVTIVLSIGVTLWLRYKKQLPVAVKD
ncbi:CPBP family intramembrane metalloprotease [Aliikangiella marina]|uniref:CPBP family intramembrane metalloprotease n=1 Tax=Aliikangiella marina TaxID=1712262 RepID=A0A545T8L7_9GAMM|nr:CPBP family intramembrane glutamic endopeptidase [Aliikangiella marina]TQV73573.1 CPBP family intramembrane metalloprotease [Aliikangiella marina]